MFDQEPTQEEMEQSQAEAEYARRRDARVAKALEEWADVLAATPASHRKCLHGLIVNMATRQPDIEGANAADATPLSPTVLARLKQNQSMAERNGCSPKSFLEDCRHLGAVHAVVHNVDKEDFIKERDECLNPNKLRGVLVPEQWFPFLVDALADPDPEWRAKAAKWVSTYAPKDVTIEALAPVLDDPDPVVRSWAAVKLGEVAPEVDGVVRALCDVLRAPRYLRGYNSEEGDYEGGYARSLKGQAAATIDRLPPSAGAVAALQEFLASNGRVNHWFVADPNDLAWAATALWRHTGQANEAVAAIINILKDRWEFRGSTDPYLNIGDDVALDALAEIGLQAAGAVPILTEMVRDKTLAPGDVRRIRYVLNAIEAAGEDSNLKAPRDNSGGHTDV